VLGAGQLWGVVVNDRPAHYFTIPLHHYFMRDAAQDSPDRLRILAGQQGRQTLGAVADFRFAERLEGGRRPGAPGR
jgi:hypothetical protein